MLTKRRSLSPIGIDIGGRYIKMMQLSHNSGQGEITAAAIIPRSAPGERLDSAEARRLCDVLYRQGFSGRDVVATIPDDKLHAHVLELPPRTSGAPLSRIARTELARAAKLKVESFEFACWDLPKPTRHTRPTTAVMAVGVQHADATELLDVLESEGLKIRALDTQAWGLMRAYKPLLGSCGGISAIIDSGWSRALLVLVHCGQIIYQRALAESGLAGLERHTMAELELSEWRTEQLVRSVDLNAETKGSGTAASEWARELVVRHWEGIAAELELSFAYSRHRYPDQPINGLFLAGGGAAQGGLADHLTRLMGIRVSVAGPAQLADASPGLTEHCAGPQLTTALGLARYEEQ